MKGDPVRVMHLIKGLGRGGAEKLVVGCIRGSVAPDLRFNVGFFLPQKNQLVPELDRAGIPSTRFTATSAAHILLKAGQVARYVRDERIDLIHTHLPISATCGRLAGAIARVPVVGTEHGPLGRLKAGTRWLNKSTWSMQRHVIAVSNEVAQSIKAEFPGSRVPVTIMSNGVLIQDYAHRDWSEAAKQLRAQLRIPPQSPVIGTVAVFRRQKRLDVWLECAKLISERHPASHFMMVGEGLLRAELEALSRQLNLSDRVKFVGLQADVRPFLAAMEVYLMTSDWEGTPVALLEAMAMERPIVATAVGGVAETIEDKQCGLLGPPGEAQALASCVAELLSRPDTSAVFGRAARQVVMDRHNLQSMQAALEEVYRNVLSAENHWRRQSA